MAYRRVAGESHLAVAFRPRDARKLSSRVAANDSGAADAAQFPSHPVRGLKQPTAKCIRPLRGPRQRDFSLL